MPTFITEDSTQTFLISDTNVGDGIFQLEAGVTIAVASFGAFGIRSQASSPVDLTVLGTVQAVQGTAIELRGGDRFTLGTSGLVEGRVGLAGAFNDRDDMSLTVAGTVHATSGNGLDVGQRAQVAVSGRIEAESIGVFVGDGSVVSISGDIVADDVGVRAGSSTTRAGGSEIVLSGSILSDDDGILLIGPGNTVTVSRSGRITALEENDGSGINGTGGNDLVRMNGRIVADDDGITLSGNDNRIFVTGRMDVGETGILALGLGNRIDVTGRIDGGFNALFVSAGTEVDIDEAARLTGAGDGRSGARAVMQIRSAEGQDTTITHAGTTIADRNTSDDRRWAVLEGTETQTFVPDGMGGFIAVISFTDSGNLTLLNTGRIVGDIAMHQGRDRYLGAEGQVRGVIEAGQGNDIIEGGAEDNVVLGGSGRDRLLGNGGDDRLLGQQGDDTIDGGLGSDRMTGGGGADTFVFRREISLHTVTDFESGVDVLDLTAVRFDSFNDLLLASFERSDGLFLRLAGPYGVLLEGLTEGDLQRGDVLL